MRTIFGSLLGMGFITSALFAASANAMPVTYEFTGTITARSDFGPSTQYLQYVQPGLAYSGDITIDAERAVEGPLGGDFFGPIATYYGIIQSFNVTVSSYAFSAFLDKPLGYNWEWIHNDARGDNVFDSIRLTSEHVNLIDALSGIQPYYAQMDFAGISYSNPLSSFDVVQNLPSMSDMNWRIRLMADYENSYGESARVEADGMLTSLKVRPSAVPIPAAAWLFGSGVLSLLGVVRRRRLIAQVN